MRVSSVVSMAGVVAVSLLPLSAAAQAQPTPAASPAAAAAPAAPVAAPAPATPAPAAAAPVGNAPADQFSFAAAMSGGVAMSSADVAKRAVATAPSVQSAEKAAQRAQLAADQANQGLYPRLELEARYTRLSDMNPASFPTKAATTVTDMNGDPILDPMGNPMVTYTTTRFKFPDPLLNQGLFQASLVYPVSAVFFSVLPRHRAALLAADGEKLRRKVEEQTVAAMAKETYYNYARARAALMVTRATLAQAEAHRRDVEALVTSGTVARVELMRADAQVSAARVAVSRATGGVAVSRIALCSLMHIESTDVAVNEDLEAPLPALAQDSDAYLSAALKNRSELRSLRTLADMHGELVDASGGDALPKLNLGATADVSNPNQRYSSFTNRWTPAWLLFASLTWSPNDWASADSAGDQSRADLAQARADLALVEDSLRTEVARAVEDYNAARASMEAATSGIAAADESYRVRREQFRAGAATATDVIDAEAELRQARLDLVNASIDGRIAKARLDRAIEAQ